MDLIKNLQNKPEKERKMILWIVLIIIGLFFIIFWFSISIGRLGELKKIEIDEVTSFPKEESLPETEKIEEGFEEIFKALENE